MNLKERVNGMAYNLIERYQGKVGGTHPVSDPVKLAIARKEGGGLQAGLKEYWDIIKKSTERNLRDYRNIDNPGPLILYPAIFLHMSANSVEFVVGLFDKDMLIIRVKNRAPCQHNFNLQS